MTNDQREELKRIIRDKGWQSSVQDAIVGLLRARRTAPKEHIHKITKSAKRTRIESDLRHLIENAGIATWPLPSSADRESMFHAISATIDAAKEMNDKVETMRVGNKAMYYLSELSFMGVTEDEMKAEHFGQEEYTMREVYPDLLDSIWEVTCPGEKLTDGMVREMCKEAGGLKQ